MRYIIEDGYPVEAQRGDTATHVLMPVGHEQAVADLLLDWITGESRRIWDTSGDITGDHNRLYEQAKQRAELVGVAWRDEWDDSLYVGIDP